jgi:formate--tetrahydrofolate ligase
MAYKSDIEIAQAADMLPVDRLAQKAGIEQDRLDMYGRYKAKVDCGCCTIKAMSRMVS